MSMFARKTLTFKYVSGSGSTVAFGTTDKGTKIVYATADDGTNPNLVDTGISTNTLTGVTGDITIDSPADLVLDAAGGNAVRAEIDRCPVGGRMARPATRL